MVFSLLAPFDIVYHIVEISRHALISYLIEIEYNIVTHHLSVIASWFSGILSENLYHDQHVGSISRLDTNIFFIFWKRKTSQQYESFVLYKWYSSDRLNHPTHFFNVNIIVSFFGRVGTFSVYVSYNFYSTST